MHNPPPSRHKVKTTAETHQLQGRLAEQPGHLSVTGQSLGSAHKHRDSNPQKQLREAHTSHAHTHTQPVSQPHTAAAHRSSHILPDTYCQGAGCCRHPQKDGEADTAKQTSLSSMQSHLCSTPRPHYVSTNKSNLQGPALLYCTAGPSFATVLLCGISVPQRTRLSAQMSSTKQRHPCNSL